MTPKIKICGLKHPDNIREVIALRPDYIGFIFHPSSKRYIDKLDTAWVTALHGVKKTGVFVNAPGYEVQDRINAFGLQAVQLHGDENPAYCAEIKALGVETIKAFGINETFDWTILKTFENSVDFYLFDTRTAQRGGSGKSFDWRLLRNNPSSKPFFLSGGIGVDNINEAMQLKDERLYALDLNSKFEMKPGMKDIELLKNTLQVINDE